MEPTKESIEQLARHWLAYQQIATDPQKNNREFRKAVELGSHPLSYVIHEVEDYLHSNPEAAWQLIIALLAQPESEKFMDLISAGPLQSFVYRYSSSFIEQIETQAKTNQRFRDCLIGIWPGGIAPEIWQRIRKAVHQR